MAGTRGSLVNLKYTIFQTHILKLNNSFSLPCCCWSSSLAMNKREKSSSFTVFHRQERKKIHRKKWSNSKKIEITFISLFHLSLFLFIFLYTREISNPIHMKRNKIKKKDKKEEKWSEQSLYLSWHKSVSNGLCGFAQREFYILKAS